MHVKTVIITTQSSSTVSSVETGSASILIFDTEIPLTKRVATRCIARHRFDDQSARPEVPERGAYRTQGHQQQQQQKFIGRVFGTPWAIFWSTKCLHKETHAPRMNAVRRLHSSGCPELQNRTRLHRARTAWLWLTTAASS